MENDKAVAVIKLYDDIKRIRKLLAPRPMELLLFEMGISSGMRIKELLELHVGDLMSGHAAYCLSEPNIKEAFERYVRVQERVPEDYIFRKLRKNEPLAFSAVTTMVKNWFADCNLEGNFSSRSLYKTWEAMSFRKSGKYGDSMMDTAIYALTPIDTNSIQNQVQERLYKAIITGSIPAGTKLIVSRLAQQLECGMTHVRVALAHLENQGMVETRTSKTYVVRALEPKDIREISKLRVLLESYAISIIRNSFTRETLDILNRIIEKWRISGDVGECVFLHTAFHQTLYRDTNMPILIEYIGNLAGRMNALHIRYYLTQGYKERLMDEDLEPHKRIVELLTAGDFDGMCEDIIGNIKKGETNCLENLGNYEDNKNTGDKGEEVYNLDGRI